MPSSTHMRVRSKPRFDTMITDFACGSAMTELELIRKYSRLAVDLAIGDYAVFMSAHSESGRSWIFGAKRALEQRCS